MKLYFLLLLIPAFSFAQSPVVSLVHEEDTAGYSAGIFSSFESNANTLPNSMTSRLLWGGYMDPEFLSDITSQLNSQGNRFGFQFNNLAYFRWKGRDFDWVAGIKYREVFGLTFPMDLFGVAFLGNGAYEGKSANLSKTKLGYWSYTGISGGIVKKINNYSSVFMGASLLYGLNRQEINTQDVSLYTAPEGEYLRTKGNIKINYKEPGYGLGLGLNFKYSYSKNKNFLSAEIQELGIMYFQDVTSFTSNSENQYNGIGIDNFNNFSGDSLFSGFSARGFADRFNVTESRKPKAVLLPFILNGLYRRAFNEKWNAELEIYYTYMPAYIPKVSLRAIRYLNPSFRLSAGISYGGFGYQNFLLGMNKQFGNGWSFGMETYFLGMALSPENTRGGFGLSGGIKKSF